MAYRSSSTSGDDAYQASCAVPVPTGAAADDIVVVALTRWEPGINPAITPPAGFTIVTPQLVATDFQVDIFWKRLTGSDSGSYTFSWTGSMWSNGHAVALTGRLASGNPIGSNRNNVTGSGTSVSTTSVTPSYADPDLVWALYADSSGIAHNPPTDFTERQDTNISTVATRDGTGLGSGTFSAAGATIGSANYGASLVAVEPEPAGDPPVVDSLRVPVQIIYA